jgi:hypothetical protein
LKTEVFSSVIVFFFISKRISIKKRKAPPSTHDVYTEATQLAHIKNPIKPQGTHNSFVIVKTSV